MDIRFTLPQFTGPLELLLLLVQKEELELFDVPLRAIPEQFTSHTVSLDTAADFVGDFSQLIYLKSFRLAPVRDEVVEVQTELPLSNFFESLMAYCSFKEAARTLCQKQDEQEHYYARPQEVVPIPQENPIRYNVSIEEFSRLFSELLQKAEKSAIWEDRWSVADKIVWLRHNVTTAAIAFDLLFTPTLYREELITLFLAVLELIKNQELVVIRNNEGTVLIGPRSE